MGQGASPGPAFTRVNGEVRLEPGSCAWLRSWQEPSVPRQGASPEATRPRVWATEQVLEFKVLSPKPASDAAHSGLCPLRGGRRTDVLRQT